MSKCGSIGLLTWEQSKTVFFNEKHKSPESDKELMDFIMKKRKKVDSN